MTNIEVGTMLTEVGQLAELPVGSIIASSCPDPSHYTKLESGMWRDNVSLFEWEAEAFTLNGRANVIECNVIHCPVGTQVHHETVKATFAADKVPA